MIETILVPSLDVRPFTFLMVLINTIQYIYITYPWHTLLKECQLIF